MAGRSAAHVKSSMDGASLVASGTTMTFQQLEKHMKLLPTLSKVLDLTEKKKYTTVTLEWSVVT